MLKWFVNRKLRKKVESDLTDAREMLAAMKLKLSKEGPEATIAYGEGVGQVACLLAQRFGTTLPAVLDPRGMDWQRLCDGADDLTAAMERSRGLLTSDVQSVRTASHAQTFGCVVLYHLHRLRFLTTQISGEQKAAVSEFADRITTFARSMSEIGAGIRMPDEALEE